jgi:uncharacterized protein (AIM24 family)
MNSHGIGYNIIGDSIQLVEIELDHSETVIAETEAMMYMGKESGSIFKGFFE